MRIDESDQERAALELRVAELRAEGVACQETAVRLFTDEFALVPEAALRAALRDSGQTLGTLKCACQPMQTASLCLGILGSRAEAPGPGEPMRVLAVLEQRFGDVHCSACHAERNVGGAASVPLDGRCVDALVNGVMWVRELAMERNWI